MPERKYVLPGEPLPVRLMNTIWAHRGALHDDLETPVKVLTWMRANGFLTAGADRTGRNAVVQLRAALRTVAAHLTDDDRPTGFRTGPDHVSAGDVEAALAVINWHSSAAPAGRLALTDSQVTWSTPAPGSAIEDGLAAIAAAATTLFTKPDASRLRACHGPRCVLYFVQDHPRREWCSLSCGNRARAARHYRRHQDDAISETQGRQTSDG